MMSQRQLLGTLGLMLVLQIEQKKLKLNKSVAKNEFFKEKNCLVDFYSSRSHVHEMYSPALYPPLCPPREKSTIKLI